MLQARDKLRMNLRTATPPADDTDRPTCTQRQGEEKKQSLGISRPCVAARRKVAAAAVVSSHAK